MKLFALVAVVVLVSGCSCDSSKCTPTSCSGCCDVTGECQAGTMLTACGASGNSCLSCTPAQRCELSTCISPISGGGGGTTGGGGGSTGGGGGSIGGGGGGSTGGGGGSTGGGGGAMLLDGGVLEVDRGQVSFGESWGSAWLGTVPQESLLLRNAGNQPLTISTVQLSGSGFTIFPASGPLDLAPGAQASIRILFNAAQAHPYGGNIALTPASGPVVTVPISASAPVTPPMPADTGMNWNPECVSNSQCDLAAPPLTAQPPMEWTHYTEDGATLAYVDGHGRQARQLPLRQQPRPARRRRRLGGQRV